MADDPINIQVQDNVDPGIASKLIAIGDAAKSSNANLVELRSQLAAINGNNLQTLRDQAATATQAINADLQATNALTAATNALNSATSTLVNAAKSGTKASDDATDALKRQKDATDALAASNANVGAARAAPTIIGSAGPAAYAGMNDAQAQEAYAAALAKTKAAQEGAAAGAAAMAAGTATAAKETVAAAESVGTAGVSWFTKFKTGIGSTFDTVRDFATNNGTLFRGATKDIAAGVEEVGASMAKNTGHSISWSMAIREALTLAREGSTGNFTRMAGSASILAQALNLLPIALGAAALGFGALYEARSKYNTVAEDNSLKEYAESLGLTEKEMRKLSDTTLDAAGNLKTHNDLVITYGDVLNGFIKTVEQGLTGLFAGFNQIGPQTRQIVSEALEVFNVLFRSFYQAIHAAVDLMEATAYNIVAVAVNAMLGIANGIILTIQGIINTTISAINGVAGFFNSFSELAGKGDVFGTLGKVDLGIKSIGQNMLSLSHSDTMKVLNDSGKQYDATLKGIGDHLRQNTQDAAKARVAAEAAAIINNRNPAKPKKDSDADPKTQDDYIYEVNSKLDAQLKLYGMLKEARDVQTQLDQIEEAGIKRRMPFSEAELAGFKDKIVQIQRNNRVMAEMDTIYTSINGPQQKFQDQQTALLELFVRGNITVTQYNQHLDALKRAYQEATDPLFKINEDLATQAKAYGVVGDALDNLNNQQKVYNAFLAKGIDLTKNATAAELAQAKAAVAELNANDKKKFTDDTVKGVLQPILDNKKLLDNKKSYYDQLNEMAKNNMITENQYTQAKFALDAKLTAAKLQGTSDALDTISQLSSSKNKELAAIGKAAAVANATIKGIEAVQNALAAVPPPFNFALAALVGVATAANVAKIINTPTDTGSYQTGGDFIVNGKSGVDTNRIAMNVTNGERVTIQTVAQQQAARTGQNNGPSGDTHVANYFDEASFIAAMDSKHGERVIMNVIGRNPKAVKSVIAGAK
jgi:hypothetical protein